VNGFGEQGTHFEVPPIGSPYDLCLLFDDRSAIRYLSNGGRYLLGITPEVDVSRLTLHDLCLASQFPTFWSELVPSVRETGRWEGAVQFQFGAEGPIISLDGIFLRIAGDARSSVIAGWCRIRRGRTSGVVGHAASNVDPLTGLPNREHFTDMVALELVKLQFDDAMLALCYIDVDRFKYINDGLSHAGGDYVLSRISDRLREVVGEQGIVGRFGGDEFLVMFRRVDGYGAALQQGVRLTQSFDRPIGVVGLGGEPEEIYATISVGVSVGSYGDDPSRLISRADAAASRAKQQGRARACLEEPASVATVLSSDTMARTRALHRALDQGEFEVFFQPIVTSITKVVAGAEALLRWRIDGREVESPGMFIPLAEQTGLISRLGQFVLERSVEHLAQFRQIDPSFAVSINVSGIQLFDGSFAQAVSDTLQRFHVPASQLVVELTESVAMEDVKYNVEVLYALKDIGVTLSIDDFGTGFSSIDRLRRHPFDVIKIDKEFISGIPNDLQDVGVVRAIIALAEALSLATVAEGVETSEQEHLLASYGCTFLQGYLFGRPVPVTTFLEHYLSP
jgi:diguanylate cyclase (GGDEF)-like protein